MSYFAHELFRDSSKLASLKLQNSLLRSSDNCGFFTLRFAKNCYPKIVKSLNRTLNFLFILTLLLLTSCGRKLEPTVEDYLEPQRVSRFSVSVVDQRVTLKWSYPDREKAKIKGFIIERERDGERKSLGFFDRNTESTVDLDVEFGKTYRYSIYAVKPKGVQSKAKKIQVELIKLPEIERLSYSVTRSGVVLSWQGFESLTYNVYRINFRGERVKVATTEKTYFADEVSSDFLEELKGNSIDELRYVITTSKSEEFLFSESNGRDLAISLKMFEPSKPTEVFSTVVDEGVLLSWKEAAESWSSGYRVYRKSSDEKDFALIGETKIPLYFDSQYGLKNLKFPLIYRITTKGPLLESEPVQIKVEVNDG